MFIFHKGRKQTNCVQTEQKKMEKKRKTANAHSNCGFPS